MERARAIACLDSDPPPIQSGCACRSDTGLVQVGCLIETALAAAQQPHPAGGNAVCQWGECQTRGQPFTGAMQTGLAGALWLRVCRGDEAALGERRAAFRGEYSGCCPQRY